MFYENEEMEMPTPCQHCGEIFDLNDGYGSEKWYKNTVICENCYREEEKEVEEDGRWEEINIEVSNALYGLDKEANISKFLDEENKTLILTISKLLISSEV